MTARTESADARLQRALRAPGSSARLQAALTAGTRPEPAFIPVLVAQCAVEPDFFVRDMLTWALTRQDPAISVDLLVQELSSPVPQARSQALHTLSKIGDARAVTAITPSLLHDDDPEVARAAWRAAAGLAPVAQHQDLARELVGELGRGDLEVQRSLSRALALLGDAGATATAAAEGHPDPEVCAHALATRHLIESPEDDFAAAVAEAKRVVARRAVPSIEQD